MEKLVNFLKFCVNREKDGKINSLNTQNNFNKFYNLYLKNKDKIEDKKYNELFDAVVEAHDYILNKKDESAMEYSEKGYTKVLTTNANGPKLTEDNDITKLNSAAFITTTIVLEATLILSFVLSLFALVK